MTCTGGIYIVKVACAFPYFLAFYLYFAAGSRINNERYYLDKKAQYISCSVAV